MRNTDFSRTLPFSSVIFFLRQVAKVPLVCKKNAQQILRIHCSQPANAAVAFWQKSGYDEIHIRNVAPVAGFRHGKPNTRLLLLQNATLLQNHTPFCVILQHSSRRLLFRRHSLNSRKSFINRVLKNYFGFPLVLARKLMYNTGRRSPVMYRANCIRVR